MADSSDPSARKSLGRPFEPGQSGNPGGKSAEREALRKYVSTKGRDAIDGIVKLAEKAKSEKVRLDANVWLAEQTIGRAVVAISGEDGGPIKIDGDLLGQLQRFAESNK